MESKVIIVTGASGGIGRLVVKEMLHEGHKVYACARNLDVLKSTNHPNLVLLYLDLRDEKSIADAVKVVKEQEGRADVLVNNAGYGLMGPFEMISMEDARKEMDVNLFGMVHLTQLVLPLMRMRGSGRIVNVSSVAGRAPLHLFGWYNISKYAVEAFTDCLRMEVKDFGVQVSLVEPAPIRTKWGIIAADSLAEHTQGTPYEQMGKDRAANLRNAYQSQLFSPPASVARSIRHAIVDRHPRLRYRSGRGAGLIIALHSLLPTRYWDAIMRGMLKVKL